MKSVSRKAGTPPDPPVGRAWVWALVLSALWLAAAPFSCHNDLNTIAWASHFIPEQWNIYDAVARIREGALDRVHYPPVLYWVMGVWMWAGKAIFGLFHHPEWNDFMVRCDLESSFPLTGAERFYLKALYLPFLIGIGYVAARLTPSGKTDSNVKWICWTHPVLLFIPLFMGQFDVLPVFFCLLGVWFFLKGPSLGSCLLGFSALAFGTLLKNFPALLAAAYLALFFSRKEWRRAGLYGGLLYALILGVALEMTWSPAFVRSYLGFKEMSLVFLIGRTSTAGTFMQYLGIACILGVVLAVRMKGSYSPWALGARLNEKLAHPLCLRITVLLLPVVLMGMVLFDRFWHPQYMVWIIPWVVIFGIQGPALWPEGHPIGTMISRVPTALTFFFFPVAFARYVGKVDSNLLAPSAVGSTLGAWLRPHEVFLTFLFSALLVWIVLLGLATLGRLWMEPEPTVIHAKPQEIIGVLPWFHLGGLLLLILISYLVGTFPPPPPA